MIEAVIIADSSPLIGLARCGNLGLPRKLAHRVLVPAEVWREITRLPDLPGARQVINANWLVIADAVSAPHRPELGKVDAGEAAAIHLAAETSGSLLLLDDDRARKIASAMGLRLTGTLGLLVRAKRAHLISAIKPVIHDLLENGIYIHPKLITDVLRDVGEEL